MSMDTKTITALVNKLSAYVHASEDIASWDVEEIDSQLDDILVAIRGEADNDGPSLILSAICEEVLAHAPGARLAIVTTDEWENGYFYTLNSVRVVSDNAAIADLELDDFQNWEGELTEEFGPVGRDSALVVDLRSVTAEPSNIYAAEDIARARLGA